MPVIYDAILGKVRAAEHTIAEDEIRALFGSETTNQPQSGIAWSNYEFIGDGIGDGKYAQKYKVETKDGLMVVNIQQPAFAAVPGIYMSLPGVISRCSVESTIQGAGILLHLAAFKAKETKVTIHYNPDSVITFYVYYADGYTTQGGILMDAAADSPTTMAAVAGSAKVSSPSSQSANKKAIKLNASGYIEIAPIPGQVFLPGDQLSVTLYNQASGSKLMGFRLASTQATPYTGDGVNTPGRKNKTLTLLLTADMINTDNRLLLYRYSSDAWFVAVRVQRG